MKVIETRPYTHGVMPRDRKCPPYQRAKNGLKEGEGENVAFSREKPGHCCSPNPSERNQDRIGPMERTKDHPCDQSSAHLTPCCGEKPIGGVGIQPHLLQQAKSHVSEEMLRDEQMTGRAMQSAEENTHSAEDKDARHKNHRGPPRCGPQIVRAPAERFRGVPMKNKTAAEPNRKNDPRISDRFLKLPHVPAHKGAERERLD